MSLYQTRQPITNAGIEAFLASLPPLPRTARVNVRVKQLTPAGHAELVDRMADDMRRFGEGMTRKDLRLAGYSEAEIDLCAEPANRKALQLAGLN